MSAHAVMVLNSIAESYRRAAANDTLLAQQFEELADAVSADATARAVTQTRYETWRTKIWDAPPQTLLSMREAAEALGVTRGWLYKHAKPKPDADVPRFPCEKVGDRTMCKAGEVRAWYQQVRVVLQAGPEESAAARLLEERERRAKGRARRSTHTNNGA